MKQRVLPGPHYHADVIHSLSKSVKFREQRATDSSVPELYFNWKEHSCVPNHMCNVCLENYWRIDNLNDSHFYWNVFQDSISVQVNWSFRKKIGIGDCR